MKRIGGLVALACRTSINHKPTSGVDVRRRRSKVGQRVLRSLTLSGSLQMPLRRLALVSLLHAHATCAHAYTAHAHTAHAHTGAHVDDARQHNTHAHRHHARNTHDGGQTAQRIFGKQNGCLKEGCLAENWLVQDNGFCINCNAERMKKGGNLKQATTPPTDEVVDC